MIVTIDGPAGAGKSSAARRLADRLGYGFLDTGAMYRAVTLSAIEQGVDLADEESLMRVANEAKIELDNCRVLLNGRDVTREIRSFQITTATRHAADHPGVRTRLVDLQREVTSGRNFVTEGRDQASVVFPEARCKIFLTASESVRAERRYLDLVSRGEQVSLDEVVQKQRVRDHRDCSRPVGALAKTADSLEVNTDGMTLDDVVEKLVHIVKSKQASSTHEETP